MKMNYEKQLEYYLLEWIAASIEAVVVYRLCPDLGSCPNQINIVNPQQIFPHYDSSSRRTCDSLRSCEDRHRASPSSSVVQSPRRSYYHCRNGDASGLLQFSPSFITKSAEHFQIEIPQVESLRANLLSEVRLAANLPWSVFVEVYVNIPTHILAEANAANSCDASETARYSKVLPLSRAANGKLSDSFEYFNADEYSLPAFVPHCTEGSWQGRSKRELRGPPVPESRNSFSENEKKSKLGSSGRSTDDKCRIRLLLERWTFAFQPQSLSGGQAKSEHRKLSTALKGIISGLHLLPTHSALSSLGVSKMPDGNGNGGARTPSTSTSSVEIYVSADWGNGDASRYAGDTSRLLTVPIIAYSSDPSVRSESAVSRSHADGMSRVSMCNWHPTSWDLSSTYHRETRRPSNVLGSFHSYESQGRHVAHVDGESYLRQKKLDASTSPSQSPENIYSHRVDGTDNGYAVKSLRATGDDSTSRTLVVLRTGVGCLSCNISYDENLATKLIVAQELSAVEGGLHEFHSVTKCSSEAELQEDYVIAESPRTLQLEGYSRYHGSAHRRGAHADKDKQQLMLVEPERPTALDFKTKAWRAAFGNAPVRHAYTFATRSVSAVNFRAILSKYPTRIVNKISRKAGARGILPPWFSTTHAEENNKAHSDQRRSNARSWISSVFGGYVDKSKNKTKDVHGVVRGTNKKRYSAVPICMDPFDLPDEAYEYHHHTVGTFTDNRRDEGSFTDRSSGRVLNTQGDADGIVRHRSHVHPANAPFMESWLDPDFVPFSYDELLNKNVDKFPGIPYPAEPLPDQDEAADEDENRLADAVGLLARRMRRIREMGSRGPLDIPNMDWELWLNENNRRADGQVAFYNTGFSLPCKQHRNNPLSSGDRDEYRFEVHGDNDKYNSSETRNNVSAPNYRSIFAKVADQAALVGATRNEAICLQRLLEEEDGWEYPVHFSERKMRQHAANPPEHVVAEMPSDDTMDISMELESCYSDLAKIGGDLHRPIIIPHNYFSPVNPLGKYRHWRYMPENEINKIDNIDKLSEDEEDDGNEYENEDSGSSTDDVSVHHDTEDIERLENLLRTYEEMDLEYEKE